MNMILHDNPTALIAQGNTLVDPKFKGYIKDGPKNRLRAQDIHKIVDVFTRQRDVARYARMVSIAEIEKNEFNLNLPRYIDSQTPEDRQDIEGHLKGCIPIADVDALEPYWDICPKLKSVLFSRRPLGVKPTAGAPSSPRPLAGEGPGERAGYVYLSVDKTTWNTIGSSSTSVAEATRRVGVRSSMHGTGRS
jgi:type I restriction enzyme M protein